MERYEVNDLKRRLSHVLWIGGPPDCGKTTIARELGQQFDLAVYHFDRSELAHMNHADQQRQPALYAAHPERMTPEVRWLGSDPAKMARDTIQSWSERFNMAIDELLAFPATSRIIAEGPGFFPELVAPLLTDRSKAVWLLPTTAFKRESATRRDKPGSRWETSDPERAQRNLIERDLLMGEHVQRTAESLDLKIMLVDGSVGLDEMLKRVESYFERWLG
ncbi:MAG TPA: AAA family ATPase [Nitrolancea sp.]|jgi:hypothetical protein|nr:AAA family ATPase [Nitrolancea sp.]